MFNADELIPGKLYPTRDGGKAEFIKSFQDVTRGTCLAWLRCHGVFRQLHDTDSLGRQMSITHEPCDMDIISSTPIAEPVVVKVTSRFANVYKNTDGSVRFGLFFDTREQAEQYRSPNGIDIYEHPETITIHPVPQ